MTGNKHLIWLCLTAVSLLWYSTITIYVAVRGAFDIRRMLDVLKDKK